MVWIIYLNSRHKTKFVVFIRKVKKKCFSIYFKASQRLLSQKKKTHSLWSINESVILIFLRFGTNRHGFYLLVASKYSKSFFLLLFQFYYLLLLLWLWLFTGFVLYIFSTSIDPSFFFLLLRSLNASLIKLTCTIIERGDFKINKKKNSS